VAAGTGGPWADLDVLVYTPEEFARLPLTNRGSWREFTSARERLV
jgi:hypothetical protein